MLMPFIVLYTTPHFNVPEALAFQAEDADHAESQMLVENPCASVTWVVQTDLVEHAYADYHGLHE